MTDLPKDPIGKRRPKARPRPADPTTRILAATVGPNPKGRDLIVGDLHGCRETLDRALDEANFDPAADRLFACGDLVDRGPDSLGMLELIGQPWFFPAMGNHEQFLHLMLARILVKGRSGIAPRQAVAEYGREMLSMSQEWLWDLAQQGVLDDNAWVVETFEKLSALPQAVTVDSADGRFHVVHANLPRSAADDAGVEALRSLSGAEADAALNIMLWDSTRYDSRAARPLAAALPAPGERFGGLSPVILGHRVVPGACRDGAFIFLDTGCGFAPGNGRAPRATLLDWSSRRLHQAG